jgi:hypothetical protein
MKAEARVTTLRASHYLRTLCKHFSNRVPAQYSDERGDVQFVFGTCEMLARPDELVLRLQTETEEQLEQGKEVVGGHLEKFTYRVETLAINWENVP